MTSRARRSRKTRLTLSLQLSRGCVCHGSAPRTGSGFPASPLIPMETPGKPAAQP